MSRGIGQTLRLETLADGKATGRMYHGMYNSDPQNRPFTLSDCPKATDHVSVFTKNRGLSWLAVEVGQGREDLEKPWRDDHGGTPAPIPSPHDIDTGSKFQGNLEGVK